MSGVAAGRLAEERKAWRKDHPYGFSAKPQAKPDGSVNIFEWDCVVPGKKDTPFEGGEFAVKLTFTADYPMKPPKAAFDKGFFHVNVYPSGTVCLSILNEEDGWRPSVSVRQILVGIQELLNTPNPLSPAQSDAYTMFTSSPAAYAARLREQTKKYLPKR